MSDETTSVISGVRRQIRELVDGTIEVRVQIDPRFKADFHRLFPNIDAPVAIAPLAADFEQSAERREERRSEHRAANHTVSRWVAQRCTELPFRQFLVESYGTRYGVISSEETAAEAVRRACEVQSRAEFDRDSSALDRFEARIRKPFNAWAHRMNVS